MRNIPLAAVPAQTFNVVLENQNTQFALHQRGDALYIDILVNDAPIVINKACRNRIRLLLSSSYKGYVGDFVFVDTTGDTQPEYSGLGSRYLLFYLEPADLE